jgi:hypothetical protein
MSVKLAKYPLSGRNKMKLYRVITENKNYQNIIAYLIEHKLDATIIQANGLWQGRAEKSIVVELVLGEADRAGEAVEKLVYFIKKINKQDKVLLQILNADILYL